MQISINIIKILHPNCVGKGHHVWKFEIEAQVAFDL